QPVHVIREQVVQLTASTVDAVSLGQTIGRPREEVARALGVSTSRWEVRAGVGASAARSGSSPDALAQLDVHLSRSFGNALRFGGFLRGESTPRLTGASSDVELDVTTAALSLSPELSFSLSPRSELSVFASGGLRWSVATSTPVSGLVPGTESTDRTWIYGGGVAFAAGLGRGWGLRLETGVVAALSPERYVVSDGALDESVLRIARVAPRASALVYARF
ncbi:MAG: hypothetical protein AAFQ82_17265, partial [Myxococcota bacterium]